jgi:sulfate permease, SulP family
VVVAGIVVVALGGLADHGGAVIGRVEGAVPTPALPDVGWDELLALLPGALAIAVIGYAETATVGESLADEHGDSVQPDRELTATGVANVLAGLFQGFITGGASQSAANDRAGANTQLVSLLVAGPTVLTAVALLPLFRDLPQAALGAIVISAVVGFLNLPALRRIRRLRRDSFALALLTLLGVLVLGVLGGLLLAVAISVVLLLGHQSRPGSSVLGRVPDTSAYVALENEPAARTDPGLLVFRLNAPLLFVNAKLVRDRLRVLLPTTDPPVRIVLLDLQFSAGLDVESSTCWPPSTASCASRASSCGWPTCTAAGEAHIYRTIADATPDVRAALSS